MAGVPSSSHASGGAASLAAVTLGADAASIDTGANGVGGGYTSLHIVCSIRSARAANTSDVLRFHLNNDAGANYNNEILFGSAASASASEEFGATGIYAECPAATAPANHFGIVVIDIAAYTSAVHVFAYAYSFQYARAFTSTNLKANYAGGVYNVAGAPITRVAVVSGNAANLLSGSSMIITGLP